MSETLSVIIPVYNGMQYLSQTLDSILASSYKDLEVILVDDGSTDNSADVCRSYAERSACIHYYKKENGGIASSRNYGLDKATGKYVCFCDQDDIIDPEMYTIMIGRLCADDSDACLCSTAKLIDGNAVLFEPYEDALYRDREILIQLLLPILYMGYAFPGFETYRYRQPHIWKCIFRTAVLKDNGLTFKKLLDFEDDLLMLIDILSYARKVSTVHNMLYFWRVNKGSESYRPKFIPDICKKQANLLQYIRNVLERCQTEDLYIRQCLWAWSNRCRLQLLETVSSPLCPWTAAQKQTFLKENIYTADAEAALQARKYLRKGQYRPQIVLALLEKRHIRAACLANHTYLRLSNALASNAMFNRLERMSKGVRQTR